jgi:hypothetical protein
MNNGPTTIEEDMDDVTYRLLEEPDDVVYLMGITTYTRQHMRDYTGTDGVKKLIASGGAKVLMPFQDFFGRYHYPESQT